MYRLFLFFWQFFYKIGASTKCIFCLHILTVKTSWRNMIENIHLTIHIETAAIHRVSIILAIYTYKGDVDMPDMCLNLNMTQWQSTQLDIRRNDGDSCFSWIFQYIPTCRCRSIQMISYTTSLLHEIGAGRHRKKMISVFR